MVAPYTLINNKGNYEVGEERGQIHPTLATAEAIWRLNEGGGYDTAVDATGNGHNATNAGNGPATPVNGKFGGARVLGGAYPTTDVTLEVPGSADTRKTAPFSVMGWVFVDDLPVGATNHYCFIQHADLDGVYSVLPYKLGFKYTHPTWYAYGTIRVTGATPGPTKEVGSLADSPILETGWHHLAMTFDESYELKLYVDAVLKDTESAGADVKWSGSRNLYLGRDKISGGAGLMPNWAGDDIAIYNAAMSAEWIDWIVNGILPEYEYAGKLKRDETIASRCRARLCTRRGSWLGDLSMGSRLHELTITKNAEELAMIYIREALEPLRQAGEIANINPIEFITDHVNGSLGVSIEVVLPSSEIVPLGVIPIGV